MSESAFAFNLAPTFSKSVAGLLALTLSFTSSVSFAGHHFYTTSSSEAQQVKTEGFNSEGQEGNVFKFGMGPAGTILLYRLFNPSSGDHLYTTSTSERNTVLAIGWHDEGAVGFVYGTPHANAVPLFRLYSGSALDHFYTTSAPERDNAANALGFAYEGVAAYVLTKGVSGKTAPFFRFYTDSGASSGGCDFWCVLGIGVGVVGTIGFAGCVRDGGTVTSDGRGGGTCSK
jgi:Repeat of unknown function (DUF5648)